MGKRERESEHVWRDLHPEPDQRFPSCCHYVGTCRCHGAEAKQLRTGAAMCQPVIRRGNEATGWVFL